MWRGAIGFGLGLASLPGGGSAPRAPAPPITVRVSAPVIRITPRYAGELVRVQGTAPAGAAVVVKLTSFREAAHASRKAKVGPFWLSVGQVRFGNVPRMFKIKSTAPLDDILSTAEQVRYRLGPAGLKASLQVTPDTDREVYLDELIRIREGDRLFSFRDGAVHRTGTAYSATFYWPPKGSPGRYRIEAYAVRGGRVVGMAQTWVEVRAVGVEAWVRALAREHGVLYGLFAVGVAVATGLAAYLVFGLGGRRRPPHPTVSGPGAT